MSKENEPLGNHEHGNDFLADVSKYCTDCGGDATIAMTSWKDNETGKQYYKKGERRCLGCHKKHTGIVFSFH